tara:strand:+ start:1217 stop:2047 length:831 start_codon:yes stop_codon:yes gene_type:complete
LRVFSTHKELLKSIDSNKLVGLVPTMGSLHDGHLHLIRRAIIENQQTIISIYVNPTQFNNKYDLIQYPRNLEEDLIKLKDFKNIFIYAPSDNDVYEDVISKSFDFDDLDKILEGKYRPGHFKGVATIVEKLFNLFNPNNAYFGEKDFQQLSIVKLMTKKLNLNVNVIACKTIREADGLAMSSRNKLMTKEERFYAGEISKLMIKAKQIYLKNKNENIKNIYDVVKNEFNKLKHCKLEYFEVENLSKYSSSIEDEGYRIFVACWIGKIRIIDNIALK